MDLCVSAAETIIYSVLVPSILHSHLSMASLQGTLMRPHASIVAKGFMGWLGEDDDPWQEHIKWFPNCIYVRYVMNGNEQSSDVDDSNVPKHKCTIVLRTLM